MPQDLFVEIFPLEVANLPPLNAFLLSSARAEAIEGAQIARRLGRALGGHWAWVEGHLLTDADCSPVQVDMTLEVLRTQEAALLEGVLGTQEDRAWASSPQASALYAERVLLPAVEDELRAALAQQAAPLGQARLERDISAQACLVANHPSLALSIKSWVVAPQGLDQIMPSLDDPQAVLGWLACDKSNLEAQGRIVSLGGMVGSERERLLSLTRRPVMRRLLEAAADDERVLRLELRGQVYEYAASALWRVLMPQDSPEDLSRWQLSAAQINRALRLRPDLRAQLVRAASDVLKAHKIIGSAYNTRTHPQYFAQMDYMPECEYGEKRVRPYDLATMASDFQRHKVYARHPRYDSAPITLAVINALDDRAADFVEALRRLLEKQFGFSINLLKERRIKVFTEKNVESAVRVLEKESPHILLAIFPNSSDDDSSDAQARALKAQCLARGMALHILYESVLDDADATPLVAMSLLAKTGSTPYVLAEGLDYADLVVGLGVVRERLTRKDRLSLLNRVYRADGLFLGYHFETLDLGPEDVIPPDLIPRLFPQETFGQRAAILHHEGELPRDILRALGQWARQISLSLGVVEVYRWGAPRLYALDKGVVAPAWGSVFRLSDDEAYVVASSPAPSSTPQPLRVRVVGRSLPIEQAVYSVLAWSLLHYGAQGVNKLPVTLSAADDMASWLGRGLHLPRSGDMPFWL